MRASAFALLFAAAAAAAFAQTDPEHEALYRAASGLGATPPVEQIAGDWSVTERDLGHHRYALSLRLARLHTGGDGDARSIVVQRAQALVQRHGMAGFEIVSLHEGVRSGWLWGQRFAVAEIRLLRSATWPRM